MSDLDFDELDKAVSTLMGGVPRVEPPKNDDVKTLNIASTLPEESRPSLAELDSALSEVNRSSPTPVDKPMTVVAPAPSLAMRRGGRFMDVVHPSSDMKGVSKPNTSRQGVTIEPVGGSSSKPEVQEPVVAPVISDIGAMPAEAGDALEFSNAAVTDSSREIPKNDWPDPLDMTSYDAEPDTGDVSTSPAVIEEAASPTVPNEIKNSDEEDSQPLNSPFLPDAKVEKRPLGGAPVDESIEAKSDSVEELGHAPVLGVLSTENPEADNVAEQLPPEPQAVDQQLPPELQSDLMAIETGEGAPASAAVPTEDVKVGDPEKSEDKKPASLATALTDSKPVAESAVATPAVAATVTGPTSIPQQYHEEPTTSDQTNGSIYDTDSYHQPLAHMEHAKSGWLWIIWILLLLMVGGGGAVALYFMGII